MYPLIFKPIVKELIWGEESWDITCRPNEMGIIENGPNAGETFGEYIARNPEAALGTRFANRPFPLLVKIINARDRLSVQVHPPGEKSEMWYVVRPPDEGHLIVGLKPGAAKGLLNSCARGLTEAIENSLNRLRVREGDMVYIPAGLVHAVTPGAVLAEVQQNSDTTYRLYDYNRLGADGKPRQLHVRDALAAIKFEDVPQEQTGVVSCDYFTVRKYVLDLSYNPLSVSERAIFSSGKEAQTPHIGENLQVCADEVRTEKAYVRTPEWGYRTGLLTEPLRQSSNPRAFGIITCVEGGVIIETESFTAELTNLRSAFIPAMLGGYSVRPMNDRAVIITSIPGADTFAQGAMPQRSGGVVGAVPLL